MKEKDIQTLFMKQNTHPGVFELKLEKSKSFRFDRVADHQRKALWQVFSEKGFAHKLTDPPIFGGMKTRFNAKRPFDCFLLNKLDAYVVVAFYTPRKPFRFYFIHIVDFEFSREHSKKKSWREEEVKKMSERHYEWKIERTPKCTP